MRQLPFSNHPSPLNQPTIMRLPSLDDGRVTMRCKHALPSHVFPLLLKVQAVRLSSSCHLASPESPKCCKASRWPSLEHLRYLRSLQGLQVSGLASEGLLRCLILPRDLAHLSWISQSTVPDGAYTSTVGRRRTISYRIVQTVHGAFLPSLPFRRRASIGMQSSHFGKATRRP